MLSIQKQFLFLHVPKTGGNSIQNILSKYSEDEIVITQPYQDGKERFEVKGKHEKLTKHSSLNDYRLFLDADLFERLFKFSTIRNPWERLISMYFSQNMGRNEWSRNTFVEMLKKTPPLEHYICLKTSFFSRFTREQNALDSSIDFLIRFEALEADFHTACRQIGLPPQPLPILNNSSRAHYSRYYDKELASLVAKKYAREIEWGNYCLD